MGRLRTQRIETFIFSGLLLLLPGIASAQEHEPQELAHLIQALVVAEGILFLGGALLLRVGPRRLIPLVVIAGLANVLIGGFLTYGGITDGRVGFIVPGVIQGILGAFLLARLILSKRAAAAPVA